LVWWSWTRWTGIYDIVERILRNKRIDSVAGQGQDTRLAKFDFKNASFCISFSRLLIGLCDCGSALALANGTSAKSGAIRMIRFIRSIRPPLS